MTTETKAPAKTTTKATPAKKPAAKPKGLDVSTVKEVVQEKPKGATFAAFLEKEAEASQWVTLGEFLKEHDIEMTQGMKAKVAKYLKNDLGLEVTKGSKGNPQTFQREDLADFFEVHQETNK